MVIDLNTVTKDTWVCGPDGKVGTFYKTYKAGNETSVAILYAENDYGMFKSDLVEYADNVQK